MAFSEQAYAAGKAAYAAATRENYRNVAEFDYTVANPARRRRCKRNLKLYLTTYLKPSFPHKFSKDHEQLIEDTQGVILGDARSSRIATAMPRGAGKSTILGGALSWACNYGHRRFPIIVTAADIHYRRLFSTFKSRLRHNELLRADFPEIVLPIADIKDVATRTRLQHWNNTNTGVLWTADQLRYPITPVTEKRGNAGIAMGGGGILSALRGINTTLPDGSVVRPDCLLFDDVQTSRSAASLPQTEERLDAVYDALAMAGPGEEMAAMMACTVIRPNDLSDRLLSDEWPDWISHRVKTLVSFPSDMDAWSKYDQVRRMEALGEKAQGSANKYYKRHRKALDKGAEHFWDSFTPVGKVSRIQEAMEQYLENPHSFMAERQNEPQERVDGDAIPDLDPLEMTKRTKPLGPRVVPKECTILTCHVDVQAEILFYCVTAWTERMGGHVIWHGTWPERSESYFTLNQLKHGATLTRTYPALDPEGRIVQGGIDCIHHLDREYTKEDGTILRLSQLLVDYGYMSDAVDRAVRDSGCAVAKPAKGWGITATGLQMADWKEQRGERRDQFGHWIERPSAQTRGTLVHFDANWFKTERANALALPSAHSNAVTLHHGTRLEHQMFCEHQAAERGFKVHCETRDRTVIEWKLKSPGLDNHHGDNLVGCFVGASMSGLTKSGEGRRVIRIRSQSGKVKQRSRR